MKLSLGLGLLAAAASGASAHYIMPYLVVDGKNTGDWKVTRKTANYQSNGPVTDVRSQAFRCYQLAPGAEGAGIVNVTAGTNIAIGARASFSHPGNFGAWLSKAPAGTPVTEWNGDGATWVKIYNDQPNITPGGISWPSMSKFRVSRPTSTQPLATSLAHSDLLRHLSLQTRPQSRSPSPSASRTASTCCVLSTWASTAPGRRVAPSFISRATTSASRVAPAPGSRTSKPSRAASRPPTRAS